MTRYIMPADQRLHDVIRSSRQNPVREQAWKLRFPTRLMFDLAYRLCDITTWRDAGHYVFRSNQEVRRAR